MHETGSIHTLIARKEHYGMARKNIPQIDALVQRTFAQKMWDNGFHPY